MNLLSIFNSHPHSDLSAFADGQLPAQRREAVAKHLAGCQRCSTELEGLLDVRAALQDLPQAVAPRSFALTPAMAGPRKAAPDTQRMPTYVAMRIAGAGVAAVLALVVMLDAGGFVDDNGRTSDDTAGVDFRRLGSDSAGEALDSSDSYFGADDDKEVAEQNPTSAPLIAPDEPDNTANRDLPATGVGDEDPPEPGTDPGDVEPTTGSGGGVGGSGGGVGGPSSGGSEEPGVSEPGAAGDDGDTLNLDPDQSQTDDVISSDDGGDAAQSSEDPVADAAADGDDSAPADGDDSAQPEAGSRGEAFSTDEDDGSSTILIIEIALAVVAVLAIGGSFVMRRSL